MKKNLFYTLLALYVIIAVALSLIYHLNFKFFIAFAGLFAFLIWNKDVIVKKENTPTQPSADHFPNFTLTDEEHEAYAESNYPLTKEDEKQGYIELAKLCTLPKTQEQLVPFIENLRDYSEDEYHYTTLNYVMDYLDKSKIHFITALDWKEEIESLEWFLTTILQETYNTTLPLPKASNYDKRASVSYDNVFQDFDAVLNKKGLQMGFIDTESDEYVLFVHKTIDEDAVKDTVHKIGYRYFNASAI